MKSNNFYLKPKFKSVKRKGFQYINLKVSLKKEKRPKHVWISGLLDLDSRWRQIFRKQKRLLLRMFGFSLIKSWRFGGGCASLLPCFLNFLSQWIHRKLACTLTPEMSPPTLEGPHRKELRYPPPPPLFLASVLPNKRWRKSSVRCEVKARSPERHKYHSLPVAPPYPPTPIFKTSLWQITWGGWRTTIDDEVFGFIIDGAWIRLFSRRLPAGYEILLCPMRRPLPPQWHLKKSSRSSFQVDGSLHNTPLIP